MQVDLQMKIKINHKNILKRLIHVLKLPFLFSIIVFLTLILLVILQVHQYVILGSMLLIIVLYFFSLMYFSNKMSLIEIAFVTFAFTIISSPLIIYSITLFIKSNTQLVRSGSIDAWITFSGSIIGGSLLMLSLTFTMLNEKLNRDDMHNEQEKKELVSILPIINVNPVFIGLDDYPPHLDPYEFSIISNTLNYSFRREVAPVIKVTNISLNSLSNLNISSIKFSLNDHEDNYNLDFKQLDNFNNVLLPNQSVYFFIDFDAFISSELQSSVDVVSIQGNLRIDFSYDNILKSNPGKYQVYYLSTYQIDVRSSKDTLNRRNIFSISNYNVVFQNTN